jgi:hypothetical protein
MRIRSKIILTALAAVAFAALLASGGSATRLSVNAAEFRITVSPVSFEGGENTVACNMSLEGNFAGASFAKTLGSQIGSITTSSLAATCTGGSARALTETLPWRVTYGGFGGTLPRITTVNLTLVGTSFAIAPRELGFACLGSTTPARGIANRETTGEFRVRADESVELALRGGPFGACALERGHFRGTSAVVRSSTGTVVRLTLSGPNQIATPSPVEFGRIEVEGVAKRTVTISSRTEVTIRSIRALAGNYFAITDPNRCIGRTLAVEGTCTFNTVFTAPAESGRSFEDTAQIETSGELVNDTLRAST